MASDQTTRKSSRHNIATLSPAAHPHHPPLGDLLSRWVPAEDLHKQRKSTTYHPVILKLELLSQGLKVSAEAAAEIGKTLKIGHAIGAVGKHALDIILDPGKVYVGLPVGAAVSDHLSEGTPFTLEVENGRYFIGKRPAELGSDGRWRCLDDSVKAKKLMHVTIHPTHIITTTRLLVVTRCAASCHSPAILAVRRFFRIVITSADLLPTISIMNVASAELTKI